MLRRRPALTGAEAEPEPLDDGDYYISDEEQLDRDLKHTKEQMQIVYDVIFGPAGTLAAYAKTLKWVKGPRDRRR